jgi:hypothetical protein
MIKLKLKIINKQSSFKKKSFLFFNMMFMNNITTNLDLEVFSPLDHMGQLTRFGSFDR